MVTIAAKLPGNLDHADWAIPMQISDLGDPIVPQASALWVTRIVPASDNEAAVTICKLLAKTGYSLIFILRYLLACCSASNEVAHAVSRISWLQAVHR